MKTRSQTKADKETNRVRFIVKNEPSKVYMILRNRVLLRETQKSPTCDEPHPCKMITPTTPNEDLDWSLIFDDAQKAWRANKVYIGNGCFVYKDTPSA
jgi:hypothetical protein